MTLEQGCTGCNDLGTAGGSREPSVGLACGDLTPSSKRHPCPICGRQKDGDCRIGTDLVLCHHGSSHHPPEGLRPGDTTTGSDGQQWAFTGDSSDGRTATYVLHKPREGSHPPTSLEAPTRGAENSWRYSDSFIVCRFPGKKIRPLSWDGERWLWRAPKSKRPLLNLSEINSRPEARVLVVEGEKTCDAAARLFPSSVATTWSGGCKALHHTDLSPLAGRKVVLWPDNDEPGHAAMERLAGLLQQAGAASVKVVANPPDVPEGWDLADAQWSPQEAAEWAKNNITEAPPARTEQQQQKAHQSSDKGSSDEPEPPSYRELMAGALAAIRAGDEDTEMAIRAEIIGRFKRSDPQITAALFRLLTEQETGRAAGAQNSVEALDLDEIEGMDPLIDGAMPANDIGLVYATKGSGKTLKALAMSFAVIDGTGYLDHAKPAKAGSVLFIASDSGAAPLKAAMQELGVSDHPATRGPDRRFYVWAHDARQGMAAWSASINGCVQLLQFVKAKGIDLVVIDSAKTVCAKAGISYLDNDSVTALLTFIKETICVHASVLIVSHDGTEKGSHSGAKAWAEVPSIVHNIQQIPEAPQERLWRVVKNRMGPTRELRYTLGEDGRLEPVAGVEVIQDAAAAVLQVLTDAHGNGVTSLSRAALVQEIGQRFRLAPKTVDNTLSRMTRATKPEICRVSSPRGHYKLAPRIAASLPNNVPPFGKEQGQTPVTDRVLVSSRGVGSGNSMGTERVPASSQLPRVGNSTKPSQALESPDVPSRKGEMPIGEVELVEVPGPFLRNTAEARIRELRPGTPDLASWTDEEVAELLQSLESAEQRRRSGLAIPEAA